MYLPPILRVPEVRDRIRKLRDERVIELNPETWGRLDPDLGGRKELTSSDMEGISDGLISDEVKERGTCSPEIQAKMRKLLIRSIAWGGGMSTEAHEVLEGTSDLDPTLYDILKDCYYGMFLKAFETFNSRVLKLSPIYSTIYLYFLCRKLDYKIKPLIFNSKIVNALRDQKIFDWATEYPDYLAKADSPSRSSASYGQYLILLHNWAWGQPQDPDEELRPDQLVLFLEKLENEPEFKKEMLIAKKKYDLSKDSELGNLDI